MVIGVAMVVVVLVMVCDTNEDLNDAVLQFQD
jgi:multisubunit Na+/H+ antiporter MnhC subunit